MYTLSDILVINWSVHRQASCIYIHIFVYGDTVLPWIFLTVLVK